MPWGDQEYIRGKVEIIPFSGCWIWLGSVDKDGYGQVRRRPYDTWHKAHRLAHELFVGEIPTGLCVLHKCHVRCCINPGHLYTGTQRDNVRDMVEAGRVSRKGNPKEFCKRGHRLDAETRLGTRAQECKRCHAIRQAAYREARKHPLV